MGSTFHVEDEPLLNVTHLLSEFVEVSLYQFLFVVLIKLIIVRVVNCFFTEKGLSKNHVISAINKAFEYLGPLPVLTIHPIYAEFIFNAFAHSKQLILILHNI
jgi:hypothetical protein